MNTSVISGRCVVSTVATRAAAVGGGGGVPNGTAVLMRCVPVSSSSRVQTPGGRSIAFASA